MTLIVKLTTTKYMYNFSSTSGLLKIGGSKRYCFMVLKASAHLLVQLNIFAPYRMLKKVRSLSVKRAMNRPKVAKWAIKYYTSFLLVRARDCNTALICVGFAFMPLYVTINLRNFPTLTSNVHLNGLSFMSYLCINLNASSKWMRCSKWVLLLMTMSSIETSILCPIKGLKIWVINLLYAVLTFFNLNDLTLWQYNPCRVMNVVLSALSGNIGIWWYPENASRKHNVLCLTITSTIWSIRGNVKLFFGNTSFKYV